MASIADLLIGLSTGINGGLLPYGKKSSVESARKSAQKRTSARRQREKMKKHNRRQKQMNSQHGKKAKQR